MEALQEARAARDERAEGGQAGGDNAGAEMDVEPDVALGEVEVGLGGAVEDGQADDGGNGDEAAEAEDQGEETLLAPRELQAGDFAEGEQQDDDLEEGFEDAHGEPEGEVRDVEGGGGGVGEEVADCVAGVADFDDEGGGAPGEANGGEDEGGVAQVGGVEEVAVEEENGG